MQRTAYKHSNHKWTIVVSEQVPEEEIQHLTEVIDEVAQKEDQRAADQYAMVSFTREDIFGAQEAAKFLGMTYAAFMGRWRERKVPHPWKLMGASPLWVRPQLEEYQAKL